MGKMQNFQMLKCMQLTIFFLSLKDSICGQQMESTLQNKYQQLYYTLNIEAEGSSETLVYTYVKGHNLNIYRCESFKP